MQSTQPLKEMSTVPVPVPKMYYMLFSSPHVCFMSLPFQLPSLDHRRSCVVCDDRTQIIKSYLHTTEKSEATVHAHSTPQHQVTKNQTIRSRYHIKQQSVTKLHRNNGRKPNSSLRFRTDTSHIYYL